MTTDQPIAVRLYFVKNEKDDCYRKKRQFTLRDVKTVDGIKPRKVRVHCLALILCCVPNDARKFSSKNAHNCKKTFKIL